MELSFSPNHLPLGPREIVISYLHDFLEVLTLIAEAYSKKDWNYLKSIYKEILYLDNPTPLAINEELYLYLDRKFKNVRIPVNFFYNIFIEIDANDPKWDFKEMIRLIILDERDIVNLSQSLISLEGLIGGMDTVVNNILNRTISLVFFNINIPNKIIHLLKYMFERESIMIVIDEEKSWHVTYGKNYEGIFDPEKLNEIINYSDISELDYYLRVTTILFKDIPSLIDLFQSNDFSRIGIAFSGLDADYLESIKYIMKIKSKTLFIYQRLFYIVIESNNIMFYIKYDSVNNSLLNMLDYLHSLNVKLVISSSTTYDYVSNWLSLKTVTGNVRLIHHYSFDNITGEKLLSLHRSGLIKLLTTKHKFPILESGRIAVLKVSDEDEDEDEDEDDLVPSVMWPAITERTMMKEIIRKSTSRLEDLDWFYELLDF